MTEEKSVSHEDFTREVLRTPYILIRFIASFFLENDEEIISSKRHLRQSEYNRMLEIGNALGLGSVPVFHMFLKTFEIKG